MLQHLFLADAKKAETFVTVYVGKGLTPALTPGLLFFDLVGSKFALRFVDLGFLDAVVGFRVLVR
jgi:hypothetical protein